MKKIIAGVSGFTLVALLLVVGTTAHLQGAASSQPVTVRGKMSGLNDQNLIVATNSGVVLVQLTETTKFVTEAPIKLSEIKSGLYLGTTAQKQADGTFLASEVHVFADDEEARPIVEELAEWHGTHPFAVERGGVDAFQPYNTQNCAVPQIFHNC